MELSSRMKRYEKSFWPLAISRTPLIIRVDGKAFHTFTKQFKRPFDDHFMTSMVNSAAMVASQIQGFKVAYIQSDEVTFALTDYDKLETQGWFGYEIPKIISVTSSMMTAYFNKLINAENLAFFDSRAFNVPRSEVVNLFLWRARDWKRNSLHSYCRSFFSSKELHGKSQPDMHEMLYSIGKNWVKDLTDRQKNGTFLINRDGVLFEKTNILPTYSNISREIGDLF